MDGVEDQVGIDLGEAAREGVDAQLGIALDVHLALGLLELVAEGDHHLMQVVGEAEASGPRRTDRPATCLKLAMSSEARLRLPCSSCIDLVEILGEFAGR